MVKQSETFVDKKYDAQRVECKRRTCLMYVLLSSKLIVLHIRGILGFAVSNVDWVQCWHYYSSFDKLVDFIRIS